MTGHGVSYGAISVMNAIPCGIGATIGIELRTEVDFAPADSTRITLVDRPNTNDGLVRTFITEDEDGLISINQCCSVGGLGGKAMRMGDYDYYLSEPVRSNDPKGVGPFIWASLEMERR